MNHCLLMMGGVGSRFGADRPKQYIEVNSIPIFIYILKSLLKVHCIDDIVIVSHVSWIDFVEEQIAKFVETDKKITITAGGNTRSESVRNGLLALNSFSNSDDVVLIHDATHPYVDKEGTVKIIRAVKEYGGATLGACQYDTCYRMDDKQFIDEVIPRQYLVSGASPEAFSFGKIFEIYKNASEEELNSMTSAGAIALAHGIKMKVIPSNVLNLKITYPNDMEIFQQLALDYFFKE